MIDEHAIVQESAELRSGVRVGPFSIIGRPYRLVGGALMPSRGPTIIGEQTQIGSHVIVCSGSRIGRDCLIDDFARIEQDVDVGDHTMVIYRATLGNEARIGRRCIVGGFVAERTVLEDNVRFFGTVAHRHHNPHASWDETVEESPVLAEGAFVGMEALIIGGIRVGKHSYVAAGSIITRDVPDGKVAHGTNKIIDATDWRGDLRSSPSLKK